MPCPHVSACTMPPAWGIPAFNPRDGIEGDPQSPIWILGLNPKTDPKTHIMRRGGPNPHTWHPIAWTHHHLNQTPHFRRLKPVLGKRFNMLLQQNGIASTDVLKCGSPAWKAEEVQAVDHCFGFFLDQLKAFQPRVLLVLSSNASRIIASPNHANITANATCGQWHGLYGGSKQLDVILSGYTGSQQERYARLRLANEINLVCTRCGL